MKRVSIVSTGSELVHGHIADANAPFISARLFPTAFVVVAHHTVGDVPGDLRRVILSALDETDIVILTGGLGPTEDDLSVEVVGGIFEAVPEVNQAALERAKAFFGAMGREMLPGDIKMVSVPRGARILENEVGLAPGFSLERHGKVLIALPGVPHEMRPMFQNRVEPYLFSLFPDGGRDSLTLRVVLMREAEVNDLVAGMNIPFDSIEWGITTSPGMNTVRFVARGSDPIPSESIMRQAARLFGERMLHPSSLTLEDEIVRLLGERGLSLALAESCTGGLVAKRITDVPGASLVFRGGVVAYSNDVKSNVLDVSREVLDTFGAVSEPTALAMARGALRVLRADIAAAVTGIAGPGGGTETKPVGTVCFAFAGMTADRAFTRTIPGARERVRMLSSQYVLDGIRKFIHSMK
ncbi:MAG TPA: CinA family nicotinamide mononucleotide deamidase-related protein [Spirochaetota bacterium]|nr:CinA family nicotinamide mononucleotide deamidase-related protein [Spirochaetota bacterium]HPO45119.1 CinA family nicotinamide mononucleotide deamidase-related protein [Spirochaetota bacterium]